MAANSALVENNAKFGAEIAVQLAQIKTALGGFEPPEQSSRSSGFQSQVSKTIF